MCILLETGENGKAFEIFACAWNVSLVLYWQEGAKEKQSQKKQSPMHKEGSHTFLGKQPSHFVATSGGAKHKKSKNKKSRKR